MIGTGIVIIGLGIGTFLWRNDGNYWQDGLEEVLNLQQSRGGHITAEFYSSETPQERNLDAEGCEPVVYKLAVPYYWEGVDVDGNSRYEILEFGEIPALEDIAVGETTGEIHTYFQSPLQGNDEEYTLPIVTGVEICNGYDCDDTYCNVLEDEGIYFVICDEVPEHSSYTDLVSSELVAVPCVVKGCDTEYTAFCFYRDYVKDYWNRSMLSSSYCAREDTSFCDFEQVSRFIHCEDTLCNEISIIPGIHELIAR